MPRRNTRGKGAKKPPRRPGPGKAKKKVKKITRSGDDAAAKRSATARRTIETRGRKATSFAQAMDLIPPGYEVLVRDPKTKAFVQINGDAEKGCEGKKCQCLNLAKSSCKKHPSRKKVRTGHYVVHGQKAPRRFTVWVPKVLVDKGIIKVKEGVKFRKNFHGGKPL